MNSASFERLKGLSPTVHNGYLLYVPGEIISAGISALPPPSEAESFKPERTVDLDVPDLGGKVRITYLLKKFRHYRSSYWNWSVVRADPVDPPTA